MRRSRFMVAAAWGLLHVLAAFSLLGLFAPHLWTIWTQDLDPRGRVAGYFVVLHQDQQVYIRSPTDAEYTFNYRETYPIFIAGLGIWTTAVVGRKARESAAESIRAARLRAGRCPACGYDLRATAGRCPECGAMPGATAGR